MLKVIKSLLKTLVLLLLLFAVLRVFFLANYWHFVTLEQIPFSEILRIFWKDLPLDIAMASYLLVVPTLVMTVFAAFGKLQWSKHLRWYYLLVFLLYALTVMGETGIYGEWKTKLSYKALLYLKDPSEVVNSASTGNVIYLTLMTIVFTILPMWAYIRWCEPKTTMEKNGKSHWWHYAVVLPFLLVALFLGIRGGISEIPISTSSAYFSNYYFANIVSVNPLYNIMENISNGAKFDSQVKFSYMNADAAAKRVKELHKTSCNETQSILKDKRPNVIIILLESWSADLIESLGGESGITPVFKDLEKDGILFTNFYASGNRSQQGISSIYSGIPAVPVTTITNHPEKYHACNSLVKVLDSVGYTSNFYFGGQLNYGNILSFLKYLGFDEIIEGKDIKGHFSRGKLGVHDADLLPWYVEQLNKEKQPFFSTAFTLSSHSPYDNPPLDDADFGWCDLEKDFIKSAHYTDYSLGLFMEAAKKQSWYKNTIFVFMADHSHNTYRNHKLNSFEYHHIPLLITGEPLVDSLKGSQNNVICGNTDFPAFLLAQLNIAHGEYTWSKDFMNACYRPFAFFEMGEGVAWKTPAGEFALMNKYGFSIKDLPESMADSIVKDGKAYMQHWYDEFSSY